MLIIECFPSQVVHFYAGQTHEIKDLSIIFDICYLFIYNGITSVVVRFQPSYRIQTGQSTARESTSITPIFNKLPMGSAVGGACGTRAEDSN